MSTSPENTIETQRFAIFDVLVRNCGTNLTPANVDKIMAEMTAEMREGSCSWAFEPAPQTTPAPNEDTKLLEWLIANGYGPAEWRAATMEELRAGHGRENGMIMIGPCTRDTIRSAMKRK